MSDAIELLKSIDSTLRALLAEVRAGKPKPIAPDRDLDSQYGDEKVRLDPRDWTGASFKGRKMSECPADYLELLANFYDWSAQKAADANERYNGKPVAPYKRKSAERARGWAKRVREGKAPGAVNGQAHEPGWSDGASDTPVGSDEIGWS